MPLKDKDPLNLAMADHCGIDVSKNELVVGFYPSGVMFKKTNSDDGRADIADMLATLQPPLTIVESTGGYQKPIVEALYDVGIPVAVVNPRQTSQFSAGVNQPAKTDELDAVMLARFGSHVGVRLYEPPSQVLVELRSLIIRREDLVRMRTREKLRSQMANYHRASSIQKTLAFLGEEIEEIEGRISTTISSREEWIRRMEILRSVPGVGPVTACVLIALMPELGKCDEKAIARLAGLAPITRQSGAHQDKSRITDGRHPVRRALYLATISGTRHNPQTKSRYQRLVASRKPKKVALIACARKLLTILNVLVTKDELWDSSHR